MDRHDHSYVPGPFALPRTWASLLLSSQCIFADTLPFPRNTLPSLCLSLILFFFLHQNPALAFNYSLKPSIMVKCIGSEGRNMIEFAPPWTSWGMWVNSATSLCRDVLSSYERRWDCNLFFLISWSSRPQLMRCRSLSAVSFCYYNFSGVGFY